MSPSYSRTPCYLLHASFLGGLFFVPQDVGELFLSNVGLAFKGLRGFLSQEIKTFTIGRITIKDVSG
jgi:hypothetical protein